MYGACVNRAIVRWSSQGEGGVREWVCEGIEVRGDI